MENKEDFKNNYAESGVNYHFKKSFSPVALANRFFSKSLMKKIKEKIKEHEKYIQEDIWLILKNEKKVLDIGCGNGRFLEYCPTNIDCEGIEIIESEIQKCIEKGIKVKKADIDKDTGYNNESFDGITLFHVIEHLENPYHTLNNIKKLLKKDGKFIIITPNFAKMYKTFFDDPTHKRPFTKPSLYRILNDNGFKNIKVTNDIYYNNNSLISFLVFFPKLKFKLEKLIGKFHSPYIMAVCEK